MAPRIHWATCYRLMPTTPLQIEVGPANLANSDRFESIGSIVAAEFLSATEGLVKKNSDLWGNLVMHHHQDLCELLRSRQHRAAAEYISDLHRNNLGEGMRWPCRWEVLLQDLGSAPLLKAALIDKAASLCESLGLIRVGNPEEIGFDLARDWNAAELFARIDRHLGYEAHSPGCYSLAFGALRPSGKTIDDRALNAIYTAERILSALATLGIAPQEASVLEIGGGLGNLAYQMLKRGIGRYTIVDIPAVRAIQTYMALYEFPDLAINFRAIEARSAARLHLLTPDALPLIPDHSVQIVVNEDSLPEIEQKIAVGYMQQIGRIASGIFLSINHESTSVVAGHRHNPVADVAQEATGMRRAARSRHWLRPGYVEEIFVPGTVSVRR